MAIRKRYQTTPPKPPAKTKDLRWPSDWSNEELAKYFEQGARVLEITKPQFFQKHLPPSAEHAARGVLNEHRAMLEVAKRLRQMKVSDTLAVVPVTEEALDEPQGSGTPSQNSDNVIKSDGAAGDNATV